MRQASDPSTDIAVADNAQCPSREFGPLIARPILPAALSARVYPGSDSSHGVEHQRHCVLGNGARIEARRKDHGNIPPGGFCGVEIVESDAHTSDETKIRKRI